MKRILIIEDDKDIRNSISEILAEEGFEPACAANGQEALDKLKQGLRPHLILLDLMMPVKDGFQFTEDVSKDQRFRDIPVVIMSADGNVSVKQARTGAKAYLKKPVDIDVLLQTVKSLSGS
jgi:CheY-like chemotaxis protein